LTPSFALLFWEQSGLYRLAAPSSALGIVQGSVFGPESRDVRSVHVPVRGTTQIRFFVRFFLVAIFFLLFDLEAVFLYPWVITFRDLVAAGHGAFALAEMGAFVAVLVVGFVYIWRKGGLEWQ